jgi:sulfate transport system ATP-binding protein
MSIEVRDIWKRFGEFTALRDVNLDVQAGELVALLGPSGSGKTTLLRLIAGLDYPDAGVIRFSGEDATERRARERGVGFVFQHYALFRHMSVFENVAFGLRVRPRPQRPGADEIRERVLELLRLVQLDVLADRLPSQLSGGQRQRVALARALAVEPRVLLLDEPFGALDARVRKELRRWLRNLHDELGLTSVFVTHDQEEALELADRVVVMDHGRIEQVGSPGEVYDRPATPAVYEFLGDVNVFHRRVEGTRTSLEVAPAARDSRRVALFARPHELELARAPGGEPELVAAISRVRLAGAVVHVELVTPDGSPLRAELTRREQDSLKLEAGERVFVSAPQARAFS